MINTSQYTSLRQYPLEYFNSMFKEPIIEMTNKIINNDNFSLARFGDGEYTCMMGGEGHNCDNHPYSSKLGDKLTSSFNYLKKLKNVYFGEWGAQPGSFDTPQNIAPIQYLHTGLGEYHLDLFYKDHNLNLVNFEILQNNTLFKEKFIFFKTDKESKRKKIYVGPYNKLKGVEKFLNINSFINIPEYNSFQKYDTILQLILNEIKDNCIILFSAGMPCECYMHEILIVNNKITCLDIGSGMDAMFSDFTREGQLEKEICRNFYKELL